MQKHYLCNVKIMSVEETANWWYNGCTDCEEEVIQVEGKIKCSKCTKTMPVAEKRYYK